MRSELRRTGRPLRPREAVPRRDSGPGPESLCLPPLDRPRPPRHPDPCVWCSHCCKRSTVSWTTGRRCKSRILYTGDEVRVEGSDYLLYRTAVGIGS